jgi:hypothetical protein
VRRVVRQNKHAFDGEAENERHHLARPTLLSTEYSAKPQQSRVELANAGSG